LTVTEISEEIGIVGKPEEIYALAPVPVFPTTSVKDFAFALLAQLGVTTEKDVEVQLFDAAKDGFNLSIKVDVLLTDKNKKYVIYSQNLSEQFIYALKEAGHEPIFVNESASPQKSWRRFFNLSIYPVSPIPLSFPVLKGSKHLIPSDFRVQKSKQATNGM